MRPILYLLFVLATLPALAATQITSVDPPQGFVYAYTTVRIVGADLSPATLTCRDEEPCPISVKFGTLEGRVRQVTPTSITVLAPPQPNGTTVDVTLTVARQETVARNAFRYSENAVTTAADYDRYLIPITSSEPRPGANGSRWVTEWTVNNPTERVLEMVWPNCPPLASPCPPRTIAPLSTVRPGLWPLGGTRDGAFVYVPKALAPEVGMSLRVRDLSKDAANFGTEIPIVKPADFTSQTHRALNIVDIPTDARFRAMLRIYSSESAPHFATVRIFNETSATPVAELRIELEGIVTVAFDPLPEAPAYAQFDPLTPAVRASGSRVRIVVSAVNENLLISPPLVIPIWAFVSLTNNETQQVTTIVPH